MNNSEWAINKKGEINNTHTYPALVRFFANVFSYIFHPIFIPVYVTWFLVFIHPQYFAGFNDASKWMLIARVAYAFVFMPLVTVALLKALKFIESFYLHTQKDRIIPYIACGIYFFWCYLVFRNQPQIPSILTSFSFAVFLSSSVALIANIYFKISMHTIGVGGAAGLFLVILWHNTMLMGLPLSVVFLIAGIVCTSRMVVSDHSTKEIYAGLLVGIVCQFIAAFIYL